MSNKPTRRFFAHEVVQTSSMDCGPAALQCLLEGFGIHASYGRLREACQTDVDGTSLDTVEDIARQLGLEVEQVIMPIDHLFLSETLALPALVVVKLPMGHPHFLVVWRTHGNWVQVMDPARGRRWLKQEQFLQEVYQHHIPIDAALWRTWAAGEGFLPPLSERLERLGVDDTTCSQLIEAATQSEAWSALAQLDAATRLVSAIVAAQGVRPGTAATRLLMSLLAQTDGSIGVEDDAQSSTKDNQVRHASQSLIPDMFWSVRPMPADESNGKPEMLLLGGALLLHVLGRIPASQSLNHATSHDEAVAPDGVAQPLSPDLMAALQEAPARPEWRVWQSLRTDGVLAPVLLVIAATLATIGIVIEATLLRGLLELASHAGLKAQPITFVMLYLLFAGLLGLLELPLITSTVRMGRRVETRLRIALLEKLPNLGDRYFHSRLISDMAQRAYGLRQLRELPGLTLSIYRLALQLLLTAGALSWLAPNCAVLALATVAWSIGCSVLAQWLLTEQDSKVRTHAAALTRFYLDGLLGLIPLRTHAAERALRREHEGVLAQWLAASTSLNRLRDWVQVLEAVGSYAGVVAIVFTYLAQGGEASGVLLLIYWALNLSMLGQSLTDALQQYPAQRNHVLRLLEPLNAPSEVEAIAEMQTDASVAQAMGKGVTIQMENVSVLAGGHTILQEINLTIGAGEHVAIVGASGAGKSTLVGLLLGWQRAASGEVWVDGEPLTGTRLLALRQQTAWVDPAVQLWNRSLLENLRYGSQLTMEDQSLADVMEQADLFDVLARLPNGLPTSLGEGGGLVSGGEGQRVRLGRAMLRPDVRLVILDEPFRGLDRAKRQQLLQNARRTWCNATLLCITHDLGETQNFDRVLVVAGGRIVEDAPPDKLATDSQSRYYAHLQADTAVRQTLWQGAQWRRLRIEEGTVIAE